jgi:hypothetical protein
MPDLVFNLKPSTHYLILLGSTLLLSLLIIAWLPLGMFIKLLLQLLASAYGAHVVWKYGLLRSKHSINVLRRHKDGQWLLSTANQTYPASIRGDSTVTSVVSVLHFQLDSFRRPFACLIFRDALGTDTYRRLLVVLKMH